MIKNKITVGLSQTGDNYVAEVLSPDELSVLTATGNTPSEAVSAVVEGYRLAEEAAETFERCSCDESLALRKVLEEAKTWLNMLSQQGKFWVIDGGPKLLKKIEAVLKQ